jgi:hypothetical protein
MFRSKTAHRATATLVMAAALTGAGAGIASADIPPAVTTTVSAAPGTATDPGKGMTSITMTITNNTNEPLTLRSADNPYGHWQNRATDLGAYGSETVSDYSDNIAGANIALVYTLPGGATVNFSASAPVEPPQAGATGSTSDSAYTVDVTGATGFSVHDTYSLNNA